MTNGDVIAGSTTQVNVYPKMKLNGTKALEGRALTADDAGKFRFQLLSRARAVVSLALIIMMMANCSSMAVQ